MRDMMEIWTERTVPVAKDLVGDSKIWKTRTPIRELATSSMLAMQKRTDTRRMKPITALIYTA
jgi:hypothetical protein